MAYEDLLLEKRDGVATITLNVPEKLNALTRSLQLSLPLAVDEVAQDDEIRVLILTGAGRGFCVGIDVNLMSADPAEGVSRYERLQVMGWPFADIFMKLNKPVIAAVNGACVGGGLSLALSCDIRIAAETAKFGAVWIARALVPDFGATYLLPRIVGTAKAMELMLTGELFDAAEAAKLGIISRVVPPDKLIDAARELADKIAAQPPLAVALTKKLVCRRMVEDMARQLDLETHAQDMCRHSEDHKESARAFLAKRPQPKFRGK